MYVWNYFFRPWSRLETNLYVFQGNDKIFLQFWGTISKLEQAIFKGSQLKSCQSCILDFENWRPLNTIVNSIYLALNAIWFSVGSYIYGSIYIHHHYVVTKIADHIEKGRGHDRILVAMMPVFSNCTELWCDKVQIFWEDHKNLQLFFDNT